ncbi:614/534 cytochrome P450 [Auriscalpium vulgare]|uniref:614/534 cytochrome P450 n=1 Tax=Auriscalpium vulgare TaxID=40419 RepID=A0ACB8RT86_9AGAM|nr:614/534 cytochrome P450 [Auriscalpium vulgare]
MQPAILLAAALTLAYVVHVLLNFRRALQEVGHFPGTRSLLSPVSIAGKLMPYVKGVNAIPFRAMLYRFQEFHNLGWTAFTHVSAWPRPQIFIYIADPVTIKEVTSQRARFPKPGHFYTIVTCLGPNIISAVGAQWKTYRKIATPAFSEKNNKLVWDETVLVVRGLFNTHWCDVLEITTDDVTEVTTAMAVQVFSAAAFGRHISWTDTEHPPAGHVLTFKDALVTASSNVLPQIVLPRWTMWLTAHLRKVRCAFDELDAYIAEMIQERKSALAVGGTGDEKGDLFNNLVAASVAEDGDSILSDRELTGNMFAFLLAGHESSAHTLAFCLAQLALHPDVQERLYAEVSTVVPNGNPRYHQMSSLPYCLAVLYETLRLRYAVTLPKQSAEDTSLPITRTDGTDARDRIVVPKGAIVSIHVAGLHTNPMYWDDPMAFKPERFLGDWPRDAFVPFSQGARACIGRKFFETEGMAVLAMLVAQYTIAIKPESKFAHETAEARAARVLRAVPGVTTTPVRVPLVFRRRI